MTTKEYQVLKHALRILQKEINKPAYRCKGFNFNCLQCRFTRFVQELEALVVTVFGDDFKGN